MSLPKFYSENMKRVPAIQASDVDLVNIMSELDVLKNAVKKLSDEISNLRTVSSRPLSSAGEKSGASWQRYDQPATVALPPCGKTEARSDGRSYASVVNAPTNKSLQNGGNGGVQWKGQVRKPPVVGTKSADVGGAAGRLKASDIPRTFDLYVGNLDVHSTPEQVKENLVFHNLRVISCDIVRSSRFSDVRSVAAHIILDAWDKEKVFNPEFWPSESIVRPWRRSRRRRVSWNAWDGDDEHHRRDSFSMYND